VSPSPNSNDSFQAAPGARAG
ncbi:MAG: hypothetical protein AVDCRST_MAG91-577, partial [uncultured Sphingomonadaceae bacterium]